MIGAQGAAPPEAPAPLPEDGRILYFVRDRERFPFLSHFFPAPFVLDGETWPTVEHWYQAWKSDDPDYRAAIRRAVSPGLAKRFGASPTAPRKVSGQSWFRRNGRSFRPDWDEVKLEVMRRGDRAKFSQHPELARRLVATFPAKLVEDTTSDAFWGLGPNGSGENRAGRVLMEIRSGLLR